eukprot:1442750-Rhodomonas_salina.1
MRGRSPMAPASFALERMHEGDVADHGHAAPGAQFPLDVGMTIITREGRTGELGWQDDGQHVLVTSVEGRSGVRDTRLRVVPCSIVKRLARASAAYLRLCERPRLQRLEQQGVTAPHLKESLGKVVVRAGVKSAKERCGAMGDCAFRQMRNRADEGGQVRGLDVNELLFLPVEQILELIRARWPTQDVDVRLPVLHVLLGDVSLPRDARFCRV